jgi:hypothetical protein
VAADPALYLERAERSLVCGSIEQKLRALFFLELSRSPQALPILHKAGHWLARHQMPEVMTQIVATIARLERMPSEEVSFQFPQPTTEEMSHE